MDIFAINREDDHVCQHSIIKTLKVDSSIYALTFVAMLKSVEKEHNLSNYQNDLFFKTSMIFCFQVGTLYVLFTTMYSEEDHGHTEPTDELMVIRLLCCYLYHLTTYGDAVDSWQRLKFLKNNPDLFESRHHLAILTITLYQFSVTVICEFLNMILITQQETSI